MNSTKRYGVLKKYVLFFVFIIVVVGFLPNITQAQNLPGGVDAVARGEIDTSGRPIIPPTSGPGAVDPGGAAAPGGAPGATTEPTRTTKDTPTVQVNPGNAVTAWLFEYAITFVGRVVALAGYFFDYALREFVIGFGENYKNKNTGYAVETVWKVVRDVFNLTFIFGIIYIGFRLILNNDDSRAKSTLVSLLAAALLVNFSLFITKFIIDFANLTATEVYNALPIDKIGEIGGFGQLYLRTVRLSTALEYGNDFTQVNFSLGYIFGVILLFLITIFVLLAGAVLITIRFFVLLLYMIFSPLMFIGWVFPNLAGVTSKWWSGFLGRAFFAPAYVFMLYITFYLTTMYRDGRPNNTSSMANIFGAASDSLGGDAFAYFSLASISMIASVVIAQKMGAAGASTVIAVGHKLRRGGQSFIGRNTIGYGSEKLANLNNRMEGTRTGRNFKRALTAASLGTFNERTRQNVFNSGKNAKFGGSYSRTDDKKFTSELTTTQAQGALNSIVAKGLKSGASDAEKIALEREVAGASQPQLVSLLSSYKPGTAEYGKIVQSMSHNQVNKLLEAKTDEFDDGSKATLAKTRGIEVVKRIEKAHNHIQEGIPKASADDLVAMGYDKMLENAFFLTSKQMDDLKTKLTPTEYANIEAARKDKLESTFNDPQKIAAVFKKPKWNNQNNTVQYNDLKKDSEIAKLPAIVLTNVNALAYMNPRVLDEILRNDLLDSDQRNTIRGHITRLSRQANPPNNVKNLNDWLTSTPAGRSF